VLLIVYTLNVSAGHRPNYRLHLCSFELPSSLLGTCADRRVSALQRLLYILHLRFDGLHQPCWHFVIGPAKGTYLALSATNHMYFFAVFSPVVWPTGWNISESSLAIIDVPVPQHNWGLGNMICELNTFDWEKMPFLKYTKEDSTGTLQDEMVKQHYDQYGVMLSC